MNKRNREENAKRNIYISFACQLITIFCGLIVPRCMLTAFGSDANGAITSISTFLGYIALLEGGIGGVARAALYRPLAEKDQNGISAVMSEMKSFFRKVGAFFCIYVLIIACTFRYISHTDIFDWTTSFFLVIILSLSTFAQYFIGISNMVLLIAAQKQYIVNLINVVGTIVNMIIILVLTYFRFDLLIVKFVSGLVFAAKPVALWIVVKKQYHLLPVRTDKTVLKDKWTGLGQHIAFFIHSHTDVVVLTVFSNLRAVSVYGVYYLVTNSVQTIAASFSSGMEAVFGDMYAKKENEKLYQTFSIYDLLVSVISILLFGITIVMIVPFVSLYTKGITDTNYIEPVFGTILAVACLLHCLRIPYHNMIIASGQFKQTNMASYGEGIINIVSSITLVHYFGLVGVAIGTVLANLFRFTFYAFYLSRHILHRNLLLWIKRETINIITIIIVAVIGNLIVSIFQIDSYFQWIVAACAVAVAAGIITLVINLLLYKKECYTIWHHFTHR